MSRGKLKRFADNEKRENIIQEGKPVFENIKGHWSEDYFKNDHPITVELACGRGEYTVGLARKFPDQNFIGVDIKGDRIWKGSGIAIEEGLENVAFLRTQIQQMDKFFAKGEVDEIWITFPDPRPKDRDEKRRITNPRFMDLYKSLVADDAWIRLKTDNTQLFDYTRDVLNNRKDIKNMKYTYDLYYSEYKDECHGIRTRFEKKFSEIGHDIKYLKFQFS
ncbi:MAG: tRNA (guanosine(46)-N7)-methyltransferase TrmB [Fulvivirga sp.]|nr:tRNA (guanosine(46)-N7)-methyltransferase TrmB [Fulvivirga sp.]